MKVLAKANRRIWYDPHLRLWTMQVVDEQGDQVGEVVYTTNRFAAAYWLNALATPPVPSLK